MIRFSIMGITGYLLTLTLSTAVAWIGWVTVLYQVNPDETGLVGFALFYLTLAVALFGTLTLLGTLVRVRKQGQTAVLAREVKLAFRHSAILTTACVILLFLAANEKLGWLSFLLVGVLAIGVEAGFLLFQSGRRV